MITKRQLKRELLAIRDGIPQKQLKEKSEAIFEKVFASDCYKNARSVLIYKSFKSEVSTEEAIGRMLKEKLVYVPIITETDKLAAVRIYTTTEFKEGKFGIFEPCGGKVADKSEIDLCIIPGAAFDKVGGRAGYGKAYYDIFLRGTSMYKLAVCYDFQLVEYIPVDLLDVNMDMVVTENREIVINSEKTLIYN